MQLPLPSQLDKQKVLDKILLEKDVDALSSLAQEAFLQTKTKQYVPATPRGILKLLQEYEIAISSKRIVVIGKSNIVGKPTAILLQEQGADVESCDKKTLNIPEKTKSADIIIVAAGAPKLVTKEYLDVNRDDYVIVDVGVTKDNNQKIHGDVDFEGVQSFTAAMSPVPGGVGPMTVLSLFENFADRIGK